MRNIILSIVTSSLLTGCAALPELNANLAQVNDTLRSANYNLRNSPSSSQPVTAEADDRVCDQTAFQAGFTDQYVLNWNMEIGHREATYRFLAKHHPDDAAARHNYELYRGKLLSSKGTGKAMEYGLTLDGQGLLNPCQSSSYAQGQSAGLRAVARDLKTLAEQEIERHYD